jgi:hypothetical protein
MSVQDELFLPRDLNEDSILNQGVEEAAGDHQVIGASSLAGGHQGSVAGSGWNLGGQGQPPPNIGHVPSHISIETHATAATSLVATSGYFVGATSGQWLKLMPAGSFSPRVPMESLAPMTIHVTKRQLLRLSHMSLPVLSTFMPRMQRGNLPTRTLTSSSNMLVILPRSIILNVI